MSVDLKKLMNQIEQTMKLPRDNGELIFHTPWESRIFAIAVLLYEKGEFPWKSFNTAFVKEIQENENLNPGCDIVSTYYRHWMTALEKVLIGKEIISDDQLIVRTDEFKTGQRHHV